MGTNYQFGKLIGRQVPSASDLGGAKTNTQGRSVPDYKPFPDESSGGASVGTVKQSPPQMANGGIVKGSGPKAASYAEGGVVLGRVRDFMKAPNQFTDENDEKDIGERGPSRYQSRYAKKGPREKAPTKADVKTPMPRK